MESSPAAWSVRRSRRTCMLYGATTMKSFWLRARVSSSRLVYDAPSIARISRATRSASSGAAATSPVWSTGRKRSPVPNAGD